MRLPCGFIFVNLEKIQSVHQYKQTIKPGLICCFFFSSLFLSLFVRTRNLSCRKKIFLHIFVPVREENKPHPVIPRGQQAEGILSSFVLQKNRYPSYRLKIRSNWPVSWAINMNLLHIISHCATFISEDLGKSKDIWF